MAAMSEEICYYEEVDRYICFNRHCNLNQFKNFFLSSCLSRIFKFMACVFSVMYKGQSVKGLHVEIVATDGNCQRFPYKFQQICHYNYRHLPCNLSHQQVIHILP
jgi:hypothetical protein